MFNEIIEKIKKAAVETGSAELIEIAKRVDTAADRGNFLKIAIVTDDYGIKEARKLIFKLMNEDMNSVPEWDSVPVKAVYKKGAEASVFVDKNEDANFAEVLITVKSDELNNAEIWLFAGIRHKDISSDILDDIDVVVLLSNATMMLPLGEKEWLKNTVVPRFGADRTFVSMYGINMLNTVTDLEEVKSNAKKILSNADDAITFCAEEKDLTAMLVQSISDPADLEDKRKKTVLANVIADIKDKGLKLLKTASCGEDKIKEALENLEKERRNIELSSNITVNSVVENKFSALNSQLIGAAEEYNRSAYESIIAKLKVSEDIQSDAASVNGYLEGVWRNFEIASEKRFTEALEEISKELSKQIAIDCDNILDIVRPIGIDADFKKIRLKNNSVDISDVIDEKADKTKKMKRMTLLISGGLLVLSGPLVSAAVLIGGNLLIKYNKGNDAEFKDEIIKSVKKSCEDVVIDVKKSIISSIEQAEKKAKDNVKVIYADVVDAVIGLANDAVKKAEGLREQRASLEKFINITIPDIECLL